MMDWNEFRIELIKRLNTCSTEKEFEDLLKAIIMAIIKNMGFEK